MAGENSTFLGEHISVIKVFGLTFNVGNLVAGTLAAAIVFFVVLALSRNLKVKPTSIKQNIIEWMAGFTNGMVKDTMNGDDAPKFSLYAFTLFFFIFFANQLGMLLQVRLPNGVTYIKSPTADPIVTLTLALMTLMMAHFAGIMKFGFKKYFSHTYFQPFKVWLPLSVFGEFTNFLTLGLRLFGNIFAGELLLKTIGNFAFSHGIWTLIAGAPLGIIWQGFSVFIGSIQAFVFVILSSVYISQKLSD
nr:F0F1 ATP synthase subunit A [Acetilactobacillus jinshanensis]